MKKIVKPTIEDLRARREAIRRKPPAREGDKMITSVQLVVIYDDGSEDRLDLPAKEKIETK